jgi:phosphoglycolate phosphatase
MKRKKVCLFDLDLTLVHTGGAGGKSLEQAFHHLYGIPDILKVITFDGKTDTGIAREMIQSFLYRDPQIGEVDRILRAYLDNLKRMIPNVEGYRVLPGVYEILDLLSRREDVLLGLGTGNLREGAEIKLARANLMRYFPFGGFSDDAEERFRVLAAGVARAEKILGYKPEPQDVIIIGDNARDISAGKAIGAVTVAVATGPMTLEELKTHAPDVAIPDLTHRDALLGLLEGITEIPA